MRFLFKTSYVQELGLFRDNVQRNWYVALFAALLVLPRVVPDYVGDISLVFIYGLCGLSLMVLAGYTGLVSLGHAAFLGIGAYAHVYFTQDLHLPWILSVVLAAAISAAVGVIVGVPALRMTGVYLTIATLAFALIIQEVFTQWDRVTGGLKGKAVDKVVAFGLPLAGPRFGRRFRRHAAGRDLAGARRAAGVDGAIRRRVRQSRRQRDVSRRRSLREAAGPRAGDLRPHPGAVHPVRAPRDLRPLEQDQGLLLAVPALQARDVPPPARVHA